MCQADMTLIPFRWGKIQAKPIANFRASHSCVNWDHINDWAGQHYVDAFEPGMLVHPTLGKQLPVLSKSYED
jgi:hypothetical protein